LNDWDWKIPEKQHINNYLIMFNLYLLICSILWTTIGSTLKKTWLHVLLFFFFFLGATYDKMDYNKDIVSWCHKPGPHNNMEESGNTQNTYLVPRYNINTKHKAFTNTQKTLFFNSIPKKTMQNFT
jgi:hypothetical protein